MTVCSSSSLLMTIQPKSSAERDNSVLLQSALKASSGDISTQLLDYASLDKSDCEASCILIALANHESSLLLKQQALLFQQQKREIVVRDIIEKEQQKDTREVVVIQDDSPQEETEMTTVINKQQAISKKNDPIMLLMQAAEVVNSEEYSQQHHYSKKRSHSHHSHHSHTHHHSDKKSKYETYTMSPPISPSPKYNSHDNNYKLTNNSFSRQYHSMKQNPKIKQNALHTYITYMIYNDKLHKKNSSIDTLSSWYNTAPSTSVMPPTPPIVQKNDLLSRPLTAFLWNNNNVVLPPLSRLERLV